jgi:hypothetical protein
VQASLRPCLCNKTNTSIQNSVFASILGPVLETTQQDFLQEAKSLIAQHHKRLNEVMLFII